MTRTVNGYEIGPGANLSSADLAGADLRGVILAGADLRGAILSGANLYGASLHGAHLHNTSLFRANLCEADLRNAIVDARGGHWDARCWPWLSGHQYDAEMRVPGLVRIGCRTRTIEQWLGEEGQRLAVREGCLGTLEQQTLVSWLELLRDVDPERLGWCAGSSTYVPPPRSRAWCGLRIPALLDPAPGPE